MATGTLFDMQAQVPMQFDLAVPLVEKYRPKRVENFIGLDKVKRIISKFLQRPYSTAFTFCGPPGCGKTSLAMAMSAELNATFWHVGSQSLTADKVRELCYHAAYIPKAGLSGFHFILVDEVDTASKAALQALLSVLDSTEGMKNTVWAFTCNSCTDLDERFLSRTQRIDFCQYGSSGEIVEFLERVWKAEAGDAPLPNLKKIAVGNIRESLQRVSLEVMAL